MGDLGTLPEHAGVSWSLSLKPCTPAGVFANLTGLKSEEDPEGFVCSKPDLKRESTDTKQEPEGTDLSEDGSDTISGKVSLFSGKSRGREEL